MLPELTATTNQPTNTSSKTDVPDSSQEIDTSPFDFFALLDTFEQYIQEVTSSKEFLQIVELVRSSLQTSADNEKLNALLSELKTKLSESKNELVKPTLYQQLESLVHQNRHFSESEKKRIHTLLENRLKKIIDPQNTEIQLPLFPPYDRIQAFKKELESRLKIVTIFANRNKTTFLATQRALQRYLDSFKRSLVIWDQEYPRSIPFSQEYETLIAQFQEKANQIKYQTSQSPSTSVVQTKKVG